MKKILFLLFIIIYPQISFAQTFEVGKDQYLIKCDDNLTIEIPQNTFNESVYIDCQKATMDEIAKIKYKNDSIIPIYLFKVRSKNNKEISFFRNELKLNYVINTDNISPENLNIFFYDEDYKNWIMLSSEKNNNIISSKLFHTGFIGAFIKANDNQNIDIYTNLAFYILVIVFMISSIGIFFAIINKKEL